jgi:hypothetical protein
MIPALREPLFELIRHGLLVERHQNVIVLCTPIDNRKILAFERQIQRVSHSLGIESIDASRIVSLYHSPEHPALVFIDQKLDGRH